MPSGRGAEYPSPAESNDPDVAYLRKILNRLKSERLAKGITLRQLEDLTGISNAHLSRAERGLTEAGVVILRRWCRALGLTFEEVCCQAAKEK